MRHALHYMHDHPIVVVAGAVVGRRSHGKCENPNATFGKGGKYKLVGDTTFGWRTGTLTGNIDLNGHTLVMDTGGGQPTVFRGAITGKGSLEWCGGGVPQVSPSVLAATSPTRFKAAYALARRAGPGQARRRRLPSPAT